MAHPLVEELRRKADGIPRGNAHVVVVTRLRARAAADIVSAAVQVDPTLTDQDRRWDLDLLAEIFRQLKPLAKQAEVTLRREELEVAGADQREIARLGRTNPDAPDELEALSQRAVEIADRIKAAAVPEWTPELVRERSEGLLPSQRRLADIADQLRSAIRAALELPYPAAEAVRLAALADQIEGGGK